MKKEARQIYTKEQTNKQINKRLNQGNLYNLNDNNYSDLSRICEQDLIKE
jgi:hypothetical protein